MFISSYLHLLPPDLLPPEVCSLLNPAAIYANNEISLRDVEVYGFDYDYTLAQYADALHPEIFSAARDILIEHYKVSLAGQTAQAPGEPQAESRRSPEAAAQPEVWHCHWLRRGALPPPDSTQRGSGNMTTTPVLPSEASTTTFRR